MNNALRRAPKKQLCPLGKAINFYQSELGYSDYYLAWRMLSNQSNISKHKTGKTKPGYDKLISYADILQIKLSTLIIKTEEFENE